MTQDIASNAVAPADRPNSKLRRFGRRLVPSRLGLSGKLMNLQKAIQTELQAILPKDLSKPLDDAGRKLAASEFTKVANALAEAYLQSNLELKLGGTRAASTWRRPVGIRPLKYGTRRAGQLSSLSGRIATRSSRWHGVRTERV